MFAVNSARRRRSSTFLNGFLHYVVTADIGPTSADVTTHIDAEGIGGRWEVTGARYSVPITKRRDHLHRCAAHKPRGVRPPLSPDSGGFIDNLWLRITFHVHVPPAPLT